MIHTHENMLFEEQDRDRPVRPVKSRRHRERNDIRMFIAGAAVLFAGACVGFFAGSAGSKPDPDLHEGIAMIEQGDKLFSETDKTTWREALAKYRKAKELTDRHELPLPDMENRIERLQEKMENAINQGIETAKIFYSGGSVNMAVITLENEVLKIDPEHREGNELKEAYSKQMMK